MFDLFGISLSNTNHAPLKAFSWMHDILDRPGKSEVAIVDVRSTGEYRGTRVRTGRGGTIPAAVHLEWVHNVDDNRRFKPAADLRQQYETRGVTPDKEVICCF